MEYDPGLPNLDPEIPLAEKELELFMLETIWPAVSYLWSGAEELDFTDDSSPGEGIDLSWDLVDMVTKEPVVYQVLAYCWESETETDAHGQSIIMRSANIVRHETSETKHLSQGILKIAAIESSNVPSHYSRKLRRLRRLYAKGEVSLEFCRSYHFDTDPVDYFYTKSYYKLLNDSNDTIWDDDYFLINEELIESNEESRIVNEQIEDMEDVIARTMSRSECNDLRQFFVCAGVPEEILGGSL